MKKITIWDIKRKNTVWQVKTKRSSQKPPASMEGNFQIFLDEFLKSYFCMIMKEENEWKREWIELALEEYRDVAEREKMTSLPSNSLLSLQNCLRSEIGKRLKQTSKDPHFRSFVAEVELLELIAREKEEKERKRKKKKEENKKRKKKEEKQKMAENAENANLENLENIQKEKKVQEEEIESIFTPKDDLDSLDPDDRDVEIFKKFCLGTRFHFFIFIKI